MLYTVIYCATVCVLFMIVHNELVCLCLHAFVCAHVCVGNCMTRLLKDEHH